jgi:hypothetical protein
VLTLPQHRPALRSAPAVTDPGSARLLALAEFGQAYTQTPVFLLDRKA